MASSKESNASCSSSKKRPRDEQLKGAWAQMPSKRLKRNEFGSLILEEVEEDIENSSLEVKFENENVANPKVKVEESIPD
jgi:DNA-binding cell septation regulator SpoVG